ncbi:MAG: aldose 1-epimerase family protein [Segetibacter sp.]|nr:aldose 1-epimerase family protein [Segetibacter sp.]
MHSLSNGIISIQVVNKGAELQSIYLHEHKHEYMWSGNSSFWAKKSPVLFPVVGGLNKNNYHYNGKDYQLNRHGFARENDFELVEEKEDSLCFRLIPDESIRQSYPFDFIFSIQYKLQQNLLLITFDVQNFDEKEMYFSVGAHPAFAVPMVEGTEYEDYYLQFNRAETTGRWPLSPDGLIELAPTPCLQNQDKLQLKKELFYKDAIVFKDLTSTSISILSDKTPRGLKVDFEGFPYLGIWAAKGADFVCIEPWCGIADSVNSTGNLEDKEGIIAIANCEIFSRTYSIEVF